MPNLTDREKRAIVKYKRVTMERNVFKRKYQKTIATNHKLRMANSLLKLKAMQFKPKTTVDLEKEVAKLREQVYFILNSVTLLNCQ